MNFVPPDHNSDEAQNIMDIINNDHVELALMLNALSNRMFRNFQFWAHTTSEIFKYVDENLDENKRKDAKIIKEANSIVLDALGQAIIQLEGLCEFKKLVEKRFRIFNEEEDNDNDDDYDDRDIDEEF